ncbi:putative dolichyl-diphosphooligosaccharide--protein glycosyltransferase subunit 3 [Capsicum annuum]|nr:putative dolichyl-diphosphooligosaccharide--protein glycosyltransferase subunit 3 [Capsicum annuum]KAF3671074.1 putative dolichyl-diphosphooligosaccharide--protein glycosyltransferase subunit 3 [Capsicum annuum]
MLVVLLLVPINHSLNSDDLVSELTILRARSTTGVIHLSNRLLGRILSVPVPRPFTFLLFFDSQKVHSHSEISLPTLKNEFLILASSFHTNNPANNKLFFFEIEFQESRVSFALFGVKSLPHVCLVPLFSTDFERDLIQMESSDFSRHAESMAEFVEAKSKHTVGPIHRPDEVKQAAKPSRIHEQIWKQIVSKQRHRGLIPRYDGPFDVIEKVGEVAYRLKLPERLKIHPTFHVSFLKRYNEDVEDPRRNKNQRAPPLIVKEYKS